jgi:hypothetical protein
MNVEKFIVPACCNRTSIVFKTDRPLTEAILAALVSNGFTEWNQFTKAGMLYVDNLDFILTGALGSDKLQAKCKLEKDCDQKLNKLEDLLLQME